MRHLTIRDIPSELARALDRERRQTGASLNQTVKDLLARALGLRPGVSARNGLERLAGTWSDEDLREFEEAVVPLRRIDDELWR
jgi:hypothetical protein